MVSGGLGFASNPTQSLDLDAIDQKIYKTATEVARKKFSPEFMNRIDKIVVFRTLTRANLREILEIELAAVRDRILSSQPGKQFFLRCSDAVKEFLVDEGADHRYGARHLKRAIERHLVFPLSNLIATGQVELGDIVPADLVSDESKLSFSRERSRSGAADAAHDSGSGDGDGASPAERTHGAQVPHLVTATRSDAQNV
jgi:ATP-dependent Clp protease ATP-binding subunit ClpA